VVQAVFEWQERGGDLKKIIERQVADHEFEANNLQFMKKLAVGIEKNIKELEKLIEAAAPEWPLPQIAKVDLAILKVAVFEILFDNEVPPKAAINEAVEIAKTFGSDSSSRFVNGVLGTVFRNSSKYKPEEDRRAPASLAGRPAKNKKSYDKSK
jgi:N utilization substance protein B